MIILFSLMAGSVALAGVSLKLLKRARRRAYLGNLPISTASVAYDSSTYAATLSWDKYSLFINGRRVMLISGEFHPFRVPDRERWRPILEAYKLGGLNCIRIYFHWGYHSPAEGVYHFDGNRDMDYLLSLCEELQLFVIAAPGPYICAEIQAGGHPSWLVAKRDIRIRHVKSLAVREYDPEYIRYCKEWLDAILPIIAKHQMTNTMNADGKSVQGGGNVVALQIENENFETLKGIPIALSDDMRVLSKIARDNGITIPLFHNDAFEEGSFVAHPESHRVHSKETFGLDLYAFDKYVVFAPTSSPFSAMVSSPEELDWKAWSPRTVEASVDGMEKKVRGFGGDAAKSPLFIAELQGGWFNHYLVKSTYDTIYSFYGEDYTRMVFESILSQGVSIMNLYMFYGGTNWGTIGDPDVYTSYDYSACIREFGFFSGRARKLRLTVGMVRSFKDVFSMTELIPSSNATVSVKPDYVLNRQRVCVAKHSNAELTFLRNFSKTETDSIRLKIVSRPSIKLKTRLPFKKSFIALGNYITTCGMHLLLSSTPIHLRTHVNKQGKRTEVWIIQCDSDVSGQMAFDGSIEIFESAGSLSPTLEFNQDDNASILSFGGSQGWCSIGLSKKTVHTPTISDELLILALTGEDLYTLTPTFLESYWYSPSQPSANETLFKLSQSTDPVSIAWGASSIKHNVLQNTWSIDWRSADHTLFTLNSIGSESSSPVPSPLLKTQYADFPTLTYSYRTPEAIIIPPSTRLAALTHWKSRKTDFDTFAWTPVPVANNRVLLETLDLKYTSGHVFYRIVFNEWEDPSEAAASALGAGPLRLHLNIRHRCTVLVNGTSVGGHTTYSLNMLKAGAKNGMDPFSDWSVYKIPRRLLVPGRNEVILMVESFGLSRQVCVFNDVRNPRGLIGIKLEERRACKNAGRLLKLGQGCSSVPFTVELAGVDVTTLSQPFATAGFPDENESMGWADLTGWEKSCAEGMDVDKVSRLCATPGSGGAPVWFTARLSLENILLQMSSSSLVDEADSDLTVIMGRRASVSLSNMRVPLRLQMAGPGTAHVWIGGIYVARYYGNGDSVQNDFYIPETITSSESMLAGGYLDIKLVVYGRSDDEFVTLQIKGWETFENDFDVDDGLRWSGNIKDNGVVFSTVNEVIKF